MNLTLSAALTNNPRTWPVLDGRVTIEGVDLVPTVLFPSELFWRQLKFAEFDIAEMSLSSLIAARSKGDDRFVGIPVFTTRRFFHTSLLARRDANINSPADLKGKRVGVPEYQQTAALWTRGVLQHEFGVRDRDMEFWMERTPDKSHGGSTGFTPPPGVTVHGVPPDKNLGSMMLSGELQAVIHYLAHKDPKDQNVVDRSTVDLRAHPDIKTIFPDPVAEGVRYYRKTGIYPINHGMVIKRDLYERQPWLVLNIVKAFNEANAIANRERAAHAEYYFETGILPAEAKKAFATPLLQHGIEPNRRTLETIAQYSTEQGLTPRVMKLDEVFAPNTL